MEKDSLGFELLKKQTLKQKLDYIHNNRMMGRWNLCKEPKDYFYSPASFYEEGINNFGFIKHVGNLL